MPGIWFPITIDAGATLRLTFSNSGIPLKALATPVDYSNYKLEFTLRQNYGQDPIYLRLTSDNGGIYATPLQGLFTVYGTSRQTASVSINSGTYTIDAYTPDATPDVIPLLRGPVTVNREN